MVILLLGIGFGVGYLVGESAGWHKGRKYNQLEQIKDRLTR